MVPCAPRTQTVLSDPTIRRQSKGIREMDLFKITRYRVFGRCGGEGRMFSGGSVGRSNLDDPRGVDPRSVHSC